MKNIIITPAIAGLPVTDLMHVVKEINLFRKVTECLKREQRRKALYENERKQKFKAKSYEN